MRHKKFTLGGGYSQYVIKSKIAHNYKIKNLISLEKAQQKMLKKDQNIEEVKRGKSPDESPQQMTTERGNLHLFRICGLTSRSYLKNHIIHTVLMN